MPTYYSCDGSVSTVGTGTDTGLKCSTGWQTYTPPTTQTNTLELSGEFVTLDQSRELFTALIGLLVTVAVYRALARIF